jgi:hypothetical protein
MRRCCAMFSVKCRNPAARRRKIMLTGLQPEFVVDGGSVVYDGLLGHPERRAMAALLRPSAMSASMQLVLRTLHEHGGQYAAAAVSPADPSSSPIWWILLIARANRRADNCSDSPNWHRQDSAVSHRSLARMQGIDVLFADRGVPRRRPKPAGGCDGPLGPAQARATASRTAAIAAEAWSRLAVIG